MERMRLCTRIVAPLALLACAAPALAQGAYPEPYPLQWYIDTGASITQNQAAESFDNGWSIGTGLSFKPDPSQPFAVRAEVNYNRFDANNGFTADNPGADDGSMQTVTGFVDGVLDAPLTPWMRVYALGGVGAGWQRLEPSQNGFF